MTKGNHRRLFAASALALGLAACGGGGGGSGGGGVVSTPAPPPPPPSTPASTPVKIFPSVTTSTEFTTLGIELPVFGVTTTTGFAVSYDAAQGVYVFDLPTHPPAAFHASANGQGNPIYWGGGLVRSDGSLWPPMSVLKASQDNPLIQLQYTSFAQYLQAGPMEDLPHGVVAFGSATPASGVPTTGSATMNAVLAGQTTDHLGYIGGTATFSFNFGAGTLTGSLSPVLNDFYGQQSHPLGRYDFVNTVYSVGSTTFSGGLKHETANLTGSFNGLFTGPQAQELMARWIAEYADPNNGQTKGMFGVLVGKKCC